MGQRRTRLDWQTDRGARGRLRLAREATVACRQTQPQATYADQQTRDALPAAIQNTIAIGYLFTCETEPRSETELRPGRSPEDIWEVWLLTSRTSLQDVGIPNGWVGKVLFAGSEVLISDLLRLKLTLLFGGTKLNQLATLYAEMSVHLRFAQTSMISDDTFAELACLRDDWDEHLWRWDDYTFE